MEYAVGVKRTIAHVYADRIFQALNPEGKEFMEARWLPPGLNPFAGYGIRIAALIPFTLFPHIKTIPTVQMMLEDFNNGVYDGMHTIVVPSSGNTAYAVARLYRAFGFQKAKVVLGNDVPESKSSILRAFGVVDVRQVDDVAATALEESQKPGHYLLDQYKHLGNMNAHRMYTGPEIMRVLGDKVAIVAIALGSGGTAGGVGSFFKSIEPSDGPYVPKMVLGVRPKLGKRVPGTRDKKKMEEVVTIPWEQFVPEVAELTRDEAFVLMRKLWCAVQPQPGPSSGLAYGGLLQYMRTRMSRGELERLEGKCVAFICPDDGRFYPERTTGALDPDEGLLPDEGLPISI